MTVAGWLEIALFVAIITALTPPLGAYMARVYASRARPRSAPSSAPLSPAAGLASADRTGRPTPLDADLQRALLGPALPHPARPGLHPFNPQDLSAAPRTSRSTPPRRSSRTRTGSTTAARRRSRTSRRWRPGRAELRLGRRRAWPSLVGVIRAIASRSAPGARQLLRRPHPRRSSTSCCRSRSWSASSWSPRACCRTSRGYATSNTLTGREQTLVLGPVASQEAIKELGTNGGGFFNVNSAMPFENPTWLTNLVEMLLIVVIPASAHGDVRAHGRQPPPGLGDLRGDDDPVRRRGRGRLRRRRSHGTPAMARRRHRAGGNMEGKEQRFGIASSRPVRRGHHRRLVRRGQRRDGVAHRAGRRRPDGRDA